MTRREDATPGAIERAGALGAEHGRARAGWVFDGNTSSATYAHAVKLDEAGDPAWHDYYGAPAPLSGEYADDMTPRALAVELDLDPDSDLDDVCTAYEDAYQDAHDSEVMRVAHYHNDDNDSEDDT